MWKEAFMSYFKALFQLLLGDRKLRKPSEGIVGIWTKISIQHLMNTKHMC